MHVYIVMGVCMSVDAVSKVDALGKAVVEKDVEGVYRSEITRLTGSAWTSPHGTDGYTEWSTVRLLLETKYDLDLKNRAASCSVLGQVILYLKKFEQSGEALPNVLLVGDKNECFVLSTASVKGFLDLPIDWSVAPSTGNPELTSALVNGVNILPYVIDIDENFAFRSLISEIEVLSAGEQATVRASVENLSAIFTYWRDRVFRAGKGKQALSSTEQVDVFLRCLFQPSDVFPHPKKKGVLTVPCYPDGVLVSVDQYRSFFAKFSQGYKPSEIKQFMAMKDRLVEDDDRRRQGAFFTPNLWASEGHREVALHLGASWRKDCVVWDCAAGTANLTRDHHDWGCLISSTAERPDVGAMKDHGWGGENVFQYDFLNPDAESPFFAPEDGANLIPAAVDKVLRAQAAAGKRLVFFINPPYGTAGIQSAKSRAGIAKTVVNGEMKAARLGSPSQQLYAQFMFRCRKVAKEYGFTDYTVGIFCKPTFMSSGSYKKFRNWWYGSHEYKGGFLFQASHFADVSGAWGISFTVWNSGGTTSNTADLPIRLTDERDFAVVTDQIKQVYNSDGRQASKWVREPIKGLKGVDAPQMKSGLVLPTDGVGKTGALGSWANDSNSVMQSGQLVFLLSCAYSRGLRNGGGPLYPSNWRRAVALYGARKLVKGNWINDKDEYLVPDTTLPGYEQWVDDCHVYALLHTSNNFTAMRDVQYKGQDWRIKNNWFWKTRQDALEALDTVDTPTLYRDCEQEPVKQASVNLITGEDETQPWEKTGDSYFAHLLATGQVTLSPDAQRVLDLMDALWVKSLPERENYYAGRGILPKQPDLHLNAWDAGLYQLKHLWRDLFPDEWAELKEAHKALSGRIQGGVYTYGFLKR